jgi:hypothetical protein
MKKYKFLSETKKCDAILITCLLWVIAAFSLPAENIVTPVPTDVKEAVPALTMSLQSLTPEQPGAFRVVMENTGDKDLMLNLGKMFKNGKVMTPDAIQLILVDSKGESKELRFANFKHPGVAGRIDDFIVPLRAGSTYSLRLSLSDYCCLKTKEFQLAPTGDYRIHAILKAKDAHYVNLDTEGIKLMNFWTGTLTSAPIVMSGCPRPPLEVNPTGAAEKTTSTNAIPAEISSSWGRQEEFFRNGNFTILEWKQAESLLRKKTYTGGKQYHTGWLTIYTSDGKKNYLTKQPKIDFVFEFMKKSNLNSEGFATE